MGNIEFIEVYMSTNNRAANIAKQGAILAFAGIFARFLGFLYRIPLTDMLGDQGNAIYASGYYVYTFFLIVSSAGLPAAISKLVSERIALGRYREAHSIFRISMLFAVVTGFVSMLILFFGAETLETFGSIAGSRYVIITLAPTVFIVSIMSVFRGYFQGMKSTMPTAISQVTEQIVNGIFSVVMCFVLLNATFTADFVGGSLAGGAAGGTIGTGLGAIVGLITLWYIYNKQRKEIYRNVRYDRRRPKDAGYLLKELVSTSVPIILGAAVFSLTNFIDMGMISNRLMVSGAFTADEANALYGQLAGKYLVLISLPISISTSLATASIPEIAEAIAHRNNYEANQKINYAVKLTMIVSIPAAVGLSVLANQILWCLFPNQKEGGMLLIVGGISVIFLSLTQIMGGMLQGISKYYIPVFAAICGAFVKIVLNYFLVAIPSINVVGAVIGTIACYMIASIIDCYYVQKTMKINFDMSGIFGKPLLSALIMGVCVFLSYQLFFQTLGLIISPYLSNAIAMAISVMIGVVAYFVSLYKINGIGVDEIESLPYGRRICAKLSLN